MGTTHLGPSKETGEIEIYIYIERERERERAQERERKEERKKGEEKKRRRKKVAGAVLQKLRKNFSDSSVGFWEPSESNRIHRKVGETSNDKFVQSLGTKLVVSCSIVPCS